MARRIQRLWMPLLRAAALVSLLAGLWVSGPVRAENPTYCAGSMDLSPGGKKVLRLFPLDGPEKTVPLPDNPSRDFLPVAFGPDGKTIYGVSDLPGEGSGVWKIEFRPTRISAVPGSARVHRIGHLTVAQQSEKLFISGSKIGLGPKGASLFGECVFVEMDLRTGALRAMRAGKLPECGGRTGTISPDGKRAVVYIGKRLSLFDIETGTTQVIRGVAVAETSGGGDTGFGCDWSPDGHWLACDCNGRLLLIDATDASKKKGLGSSGDGGFRWSPDSREILLAKSQLSCALRLSRSLWVVDVSTGKRRMIESSHCEINPSVIGWIDLDYVP